MVMKNMEKQFDERRMYTEAYTFISNLPVKYLEKIPKEVVEGITYKADTSYQYKLGDLLPETKNLIAAMIYKYF